MEGGCLSHARPRDQFLLLLLLVLLVMYDFEIDIGNANLRLSLSLSLSLRVASVKKSDFSLPSPLCLPPAENKDRHESLTCE